MASPESYTLPCIICKGTFVKHELNSKLPLYCSRECRNRSGYIRKRTKAINNGTLKPYDKKSIIYFLMKRRCNINMLAEKTGYSKKSVTTMIYRLRQDGWNIKNYHGYFELEEDSK